MPPGGASRHRGGRGPAASTRGRARSAPGSLRPNSAVQRTSGRRRGRPGAEGAALSCALERGVPWRARARARYGLAQASSPSLRAGQERPRQVERRVLSSSRMSEDPHFRRTARQPIELSVRFRREREEAEHAGRLVDLGLGGAQIHCDIPPSVGSPLRILLTSPSAWDPLDLPGSVRWIDDTKRTFGVAFDALSSSQAAALYELLSASRFAGGRA